MAHVTAAALGITPVQRFDWIRTSTERRGGSSGPIYKISYDLSQDYRKFIVRSAYDSDLQRAKSSLGHIVS